MRLTDEAQKSLDAEVARFKAELEHRAEYRAHTQRLDNINSEHIEGSAAELLRTLPQIASN